MNPVTAFVDLGLVFHKYIKDFTNFSVKQYLLQTYKCSKEMKSESMYKC